MFLFKKIFVFLFFPLPVGIFLLVSGLYLLWFTRRQRAGKIMTSAALAVLIVCSYGFVSTPLLRSLENVPPVTAVTDFPGVKWVVVLGGGTSSDARIPLDKRVSGATLARVVEGVRLYRQIPGCRLVLSGGKVFHSGSDAESMSAIARSLGVPEHAIITEGLSPDTESQARNIGKLIKKDEFFLVTSAAHMRRSVGLFRKAGMTPVPAPTEYLSQSNAGFSPSDLFPDPNALRGVHNFIYEYLGTTWSRLRGTM
jgi:uncharacterized SAM-binding protein YcdF (DUF218 family)